VIIQIESEEGINNLKSILKVEGLDTVVIGPNDLSGSVGFLGQIRNQKVLNLMDKYSELCREAEIPFGASVGFDEQNITDWIERGVSWICIDTDISYLVSGTKRVIDFIGSLGNINQKRK
jgi:2-keto-3-deoxy-L-rhamnonate aldolase RhmA